MKSLTNAKKRKKGAVHFFLFWGVYRLCFFLLVTVPTSRYIFKFISRAALATLLVMGRFPGIRFLLQWTKKATQQKGKKKFQAVGGGSIEIGSTAASASLPTIQLDLEDTIPFITTTVACETTDALNASAIPTTVVATPISELDDSFCSCTVDEPIEKAGHASATAFGCDGQGIGLKVASDRGRLLISAIQSGSVFHGVFNNPTVAHHPAFGFL